MAVGVVLHSQSRTLTPQLSTTTLNPQGRTLTPQTTTPNQREGEGQSEGEKEIESAKGQE